jgi:hypothetical protein
LSIDSTWLLVFDSVESYKLIRPYIPSTNPRGSIIITTRIGGLSWAPSGSHLPLRPLTIEQSRELLLKRLSLPENTNTIPKDDDILKDLGGLPLAIVHCAGYMHSSKRNTSFVHKIFSQSRVHSAKIFKGDEIPNQPNYNHTLETVWNFSLQKLSAEALHILYLTAFLDPDSIPERLLYGENNEELEDIDIEFRQVLHPLGYYY